MILEVSSIVIMSANVCLERTASKKIYYDVTSHSWVCGAQHQQQKNRILDKAFPRVHDHGLVGLAFLEKKYVTSTPRPEL